MHDKGYNTKVQYASEYCRVYIYNYIYILRTTHMFKHAAMDLSENDLVKTSDSRWDPPW